MLGRCAIILIAVITAVKSQGQCDLAEAAKCVEEIESLVSSEIGSIEEKFPDAAFLDTHCSPVIGALECLTNVVHDCPAVIEAVGEQVELLNSFLNLLHSVCDADSELRTAYLRNVDCYNAAMPKMDECVEPLEELVDGFFRSIENDTDSENDIEPFCLSHSLIFECGIEAATTECGADGTVPLETILDELSSLVEKAACPEDTLLELQVRFLFYVAENALELKKKK